MRNIGRVCALAEVLCLMTLATASVGAQEDGKIDYNRYYRFPVSIGFEFQSFSHMADFPNDVSYSVFDYSGRITVPIPNTPVIQPAINLGYVSYTSQSGSDQWDHGHFYGTLGLGYANRFAKAFEVGLGAYTGVSQSMFKNLNSSGETYGGWNFLAEGIVRLTLSPSYNLAIDVTGRYRHMLSLDDVISEFDGGQIGIGVALNYRFGRDPDTTADLNRSLRFENPQLEPMFAAMRSYYAENSVGSVILTNTEKRAVSDLEVYLFQPGFMDSPTHSASVPKVGAGESIEIPLRAVFNDEVFTTEGTTPLTARIITNYTISGRPAEQSHPVSYDLYDKSAMIWDDNRKVSAFITPADGALANYASFINQTTREDVIGSFNVPLQKAIQTYKALDVIGCTYEIDPMTPFSSMQEDITSVDSVSLPRSTLVSSTGDCDDLTVLFNSLLEVMGVETGSITVPGHIYSVFNTGIPGRDRHLVHPDDEMLISVDGEVWVPVEITLIGSAGFLEAWQEGAREWRAYESRPELRGFNKTREDHQVFRPVALREKDLGLQYGDKGDLAEGFRREQNRLIDLILDAQQRIAVESGDKKAYNQLGITAAKLERYDLSERSFQTAVGIDGDYLSARVNLGNLYYLQDRFARALDVYENAIRELEILDRAQSKSALNIHLNISKCHYQMEQYGQARSSYEFASAINEEYAGDYSYLAAADTTGAVRASRSDWDSILFLEEDE